jgi:hypothetical protein
MVGYCWWYAEGAWASAGDRGPGVWGPFDVWREAGEKLALPTEEIEFTRGVWLPGEKVWMA